MHILNIANNQEIKKGNVFYLNYRNIFLLKLKCVNVNNNLAVKFLKFQILTDYKIFLELYKQNIFNRGGFSSFNPLKFNNEFSKITSKNKFEREILKTLRHNISFYNLFGFYDNLICKSNNIKSTNIEVKKSYFQIEGGLNYLSKSDFKIGSKQLIRPNNIVILNNNINKSKKEVLKNTENYFLTDNLFNISKITSYNYEHHFNCCGFAYLKINSFALTITDKEKLICENYFRCRTSEKENHFNEIKILLKNLIVKEIIKIFLPYMLFNHKSILLNLDSLIFYFSNILNFGTDYFSLEESLRGRGIQQDIIDSLAFKFESEKINDKKLLIKI